MKFYHLLILTVLFGGCRFSHRQEVDPWPIPNAKDFPLDSLLTARNVNDIINRYSAGYDQKDYEKYGKSLHGAWFQPTNGGRETTDVEIMYVSVGLENAPFMPRMCSVPKQWQTRAGLHEWMSLDSVQLLNGGPFTIAIDSTDIYVSDWQAGRLAAAYTDVYFFIKAGAPLPKGEISSEALVAKGWRVEVKGLVVWKPEYYALSRNERRYYTIQGMYPHATARHLIEDDVLLADSAKLALMRMEILARKGIKFPDYTDYRYLWPKDAPSDGRIPPLTEIEKSNLNYIAFCEQILQLSGPLPQLIKKLPTLSLPLDVEANLRIGVRLEEGMMMPNGVKMTKNTYAYVRGLLPDTSRYYGVVWVGPRDTLGSMNATRVTTFDKNLKPIATGAIQVQIDQNAYYTTYTSVLNRDLTFKSSFSGKVWRTGETEIQPETRFASGQINGDGTFRVDEMDDKH